MDVLIMRYYGNANCACGDAAQFYVSLSENAPAILACEMHALLECRYGDAGAHAN